eukprot:CAMPEP_0170627520 /NCGR_PEP_ID=MMETSP0224-20130122/32023_1 /TAXON_ID=285029 /ORGANISM="Togula jolla, Strain CCCM 725" /LENGTH=167 /DNA_ID=CAMNT_0010954541 /DNA_START=21 /DNA_END=521 /DNA_ORIENTATION=+
MEACGLGETMRSQLQKWDSLECGKAEQDRDTAALLLTVTRRADETLLRRGELQRQLLHELREAKAAQRRSLVETEAEGRRAEREAEQRLRAEEGALAKTKTALARARWQRDQAQRQAAKLVHYADHAERVASRRAAEVERDGEWRVEQLRRDGLQRLQGAEVFSVAE